MSTTQELDVAKQDEKPFADSDESASFLDRHKKPNAEITHAPVQVPYEQNSNSIVDDELSIDEPVSLEDITKHYAEIEENFQEEKIPFSESVTNIFPPTATDLFVSESTKEPESGVPVSAKDDKVSSVQNIEVVDWVSFVLYCEKNDFPVSSITYLRMATATLRTMENGTIECLVHVKSEFALQQLIAVQKIIEKNLTDFLERNVNVRYTADVYDRRTLAEMMKEMQAHPQIQMLQKEFGASLIRCSDMKIHT